MSFVGQDYYQNGKRLYLMFVKTALSCICLKGSKKSPVKLYTNFFTYILRKSCNLGCAAELRTNVLLKLLTQMIKFF